MGRTSKQGALDLRYLDESGFCLTPYVPYCWQDSNQETEELKSQPSKRINVIGLLNQKNELESYIFEKTITSEVVINFLDQFSEKIEQLTVVVINNAPIHTPSCFSKQNSRVAGKKSRNFLASYLFTTTKFN